MAVGIVKLLEMIDIDHDKPKPGTVFISPLPLGNQGLVEGPAVRDSRKPIEDTSRASSRLASSSLCLTSKAPAPALAPCPFPLKFDGRSDPGQKLRLANRFGDVIHRSGCEGFLKDLLGGVRCHDHHGDLIEPGMVLQRLAD